MIEKKGETMGDKRAYLTVRANEQIVRKLLEKGDEPNEAEAKLTAADMFADYMKESEDIYDEALRHVPAVMLTSEQRRAFAEQIIADTARNIAEGGYVEPATALRLAALFVRIFDIKYNKQKSENSGA